MLMANTVRHHTICAIEEPRPLEESVFSGHRPRARNFLGVECVRQGSDLGHECQSF